jgi:hypothetical protein
MSGRLLGAVLLLAASMMLSPARSHAQSNPEAAESGDPQPAAPEDGYFVHLVAARSEADVRAAFVSLQRRLPSLLADRHPIIRRAEIQLASGPSVMYRALVGPFDHDAAMRFCDRLWKARAGCFVPRHPGYR